MSKYGTLVDASKEKTERKDTQRYSADLDTRTPITCPTTPTRCTSKSRHKYPHSTPDNQGIFLSTYIKTWQTCFTCPFLSLRSSGRKGGGRKRNTHTRSTSCPHEICSASLLPSLLFFLIKDSAAIYRLPTTQTYPQTSTGPSSMPSTCPQTRGSLATMKPPPANLQRIHNNYAHIPIS